MLARAPGTAYVHEPFDIEVRRPGVCNVSPPYWYTFIDGSNEAGYLEPLRRTLSLSYDIKAGVRAMSSVRDCRALIADLTRTAFNRFRGAVPVIKDPASLLSADWFADRLAMNIVVLVRHPAAVADSMRRAGWGFDFNHFLRQGSLMEGRLAAFRGEIESFAHREHGLLDQAALLWKILYSVVADYQTRRPEWYVVRHEDFCRDPVSRFRTLFEQLGFRFSDRVRRTILENSSVRNPAERPPGVDPVMDVRRDSSSVSSNWKRNLTAPEVELVRRRVDGVADRFYCGPDWQ